MIKKIRDRIKRLRIRTKLSLLMLSSGVLSLLLFWFLWSNMGNLWDYLCKYPSVSWGKVDLIEKLEETARYYDVPESEGDVEDQKVMESFFCQRRVHFDIYTKERERGFTVQVHMQKL